MESQERDRLSTIGELSALLAHEIKNPLNSIIINMEVLRSTVKELAEGKSSPPAQRARKYLDVIEGEVRRLDKVIKGFLDFASPPRVSRRNFKIDRVVKELLEFTAMEMKQRKIEICAEVADDLPEIFASPDQIKQSLLNLLLNAAEAMPAGGKITIKAFQDAKWVSISVSDNGPGMGEKVLAQIFNPYFTTKEKGSGLGLTIVRQLTKENGGNIQVESKTASGKNSGTRFLLQFPKREKNA